MNYLQSYQKYHNKVCVLAQPLELFGIDRFWRWSQKSDGSFSIIGNSLGVAEVFFDQNLHVNHPHFRHPRFFKTGFTLPEQLNLAEWEETQGKLRGAHCNHVLILIQKKDESFVGFGFGSSKIRPGLENLYLNKLNRINQFIQYFENDAAKLILEAEGNRTDISSVVGSKFNQKPQLCQMITASDNEIQFLAAIEGKSNLSKALTSLTRTEKICCYYYLSGYTAKEIGKKLYRSPRTVETHLQSAKAKLNVTTRSGLFEVLEPFQRFLLETESERKRPKKPKA